MSLFAKKHHMNANEIAEKHFSLFPRYSDAAIAKHVAKKHNAIVTLENVQKAREIVYMTIDNSTASAYRNGFGDSKS